MQRRPGGHLRSACMSVASFHVLLLGPKTKDELLWDVDRETPGVAVQQFLIQSHGMHVEAQWQDVLSQIWLFLTRCSAAGGLSGFKAAIGTGRAFFFW